MGRERGGQDKMRCMKREREGGEREALERGKEIWEKDIG